MGRPRKKKRRKRKRKKKSLFSLVFGSNKRNGKASWNNPVYIYALVDNGRLPFFGRNYFYIGRTTNPSRRLSQHIASANRHGTPKERYIYHMRHDPSLVILATCRSEECARTKERQFVQRYGKTNTLLR